MAVFRVEKVRDYTVMTNHHLRNRALSLKAKGLLSLMLSLPEDWDYSLRGLASICREGVDSIREAVRELEDEGYVVRRQERGGAGRFAAGEYLIYETPFQGGARPLADRRAWSAPPSENPEPEKSEPEPPAPEYPTQSNKDIPIKEEENKDSVNIHRSIPRGGMDVTEVMDIREAVKQSIEYDYLLLQGYARDEADAVLDLLMEVSLRHCESMTIGGAEYPMAYVRDRFRRVGRAEAEYVLDSMARHSAPIANIKAYLLTALFNAPATEGSYYRNRVNSDMPV